MSELPVSLTVIGNKSTNPAIPNHDEFGELSVKNGNLVFQGGNFTYKIPLEHIDKMSVQNEYETFGEDWRMIAFLILIPFGVPTLGIFTPITIWYFWFEYTSVDVRIVVTAWDEYHGLKSTTVFSLGKKRSARDLAPEIIREIWDERGIIRRNDFAIGQIVYKG
jgi:hypothetical protein